MKFEIEVKLEDIEQDLIGKELESMVCRVVEAELSNKELLVMQEIIKNQKEMCDELKERNKISERIASHNFKVAKDVREKNEKAREYIKNFLCSEEYIKFEPSAVADSYLKLLEILRIGK